MNNLINPSCLAWLLIQVPPVMRGFVFTLQIKSFSFSWNHLPTWCRASFWGDKHPFLSAWLSADVALWVTGGVRSIWCNNLLVAFVLPALWRPVGKYWVNSWLSLTPWKRVYCLLHIKKHLCCSRNSYLTMATWITAVLCLIFHFW